MKKIFLSVFFLLTFTINVNAQADLMIYFMMTDSVTGSVDLIFGLDSTATDGVDPWLGEYALPPDACCGWAGVFCAMFVLPSPFGDAVDKDFRFGELPYTGIKQHKIYFCPIIDTTIIVHCILPSGVTALLQDPAGGLFLNIPMSGTNTYYLPPLPSFINFLFFTVTYENVTPVELKSFTASCVNRSVYLNWKTETETNNSGFEIQRSEIQTAWNNIAFVPGRGTTTEPGDYSFTDESIPAGTYMYRLRQIDFDGSSVMSPEVLVEVDHSPEEYTLSQNYPNPFNPVTTISYSIPEQSNISIRVFDILGNELETLIDEVKSAGIYEFQFDGSELTSGIYFYRLKAGNFISTKRMVLMK